MSNLKKYTELHQYVNHLAEDDLTEDQDEAATVAYGIGQVINAIGSNVQGVALRIHNSQDSAGVNMFYSGLHDLTHMVAEMAEQVGAMAAPFAELRDDLDQENETSNQLQNAACMFDDESVPTILNQAQKFLAEHLRGNK